MVMNLVPITVESVVCHSAAKNSNGIASRVSLELKQPDRYEVFVSPPHAGAMHPEQTLKVAVGSADCLQAPAPPPSRLVVRRTFIDFDDGVRFVRSNSAPPRIGRLPVTPEVASPALVQSSQTQLRRSSSDSDFESQVSSSLWKSTESSNSKSIEPEVKMVSNSERQVQLSDYLSAYREGLPSIGSRGHANGTCKVCIFENRRQHSASAPGCKLGLCCVCCHESHDPVGPRARPRTRKALSQIPELN